MGMLRNLILLIISQYMHKSNHHTVSLKCTQYYVVINSRSLKIKKSNEIKYLNKKQNQQKSQVAW